MSYIEDSRTNHAILSPSQPAWLNYSEEQLKDAFTKYTAQIRGTRLHELAKKCIEEGIIPEDSESDLQQKTLHLYVRDCLIFRLRPERRITYSRNAFGTADAIGFRDNHLWIFDLKTGITKASMRQLWCYSALFFLSEPYAPADCIIENRIYQNGEVRIEMPSHEKVSEIMMQIITADKIIESLRKEGYLWTL